MAKADDRVEVRAVAAQFRLHGKFLEGKPYGSGHINDTFVVSYDQAGVPVRYILQRINHRVFKQVPALMENIGRVTSHLAHQLAADPGADARAALTLVPTLDGQVYAQDREGNFWRTYLFIEGARTYDVIETTAQAEAAASAFGRFQVLLAGLPGGRLHETIPDFHNTPRRFARFEETVAADPHGRVADCRAEIEQALAWKEQAGRLLALAAQGAMPERITHNDTKLNNVMLDDRTGRAVCVIDLDTVMPGLSLYDFGDMVRTATNAGAEDDRDLGRVVCRMDMFEALARGYLSTAATFLTPTEIEELPFAGRLLTLECGVRFLTDHLAGDTYFKIHRPHHNLGRCRAQFKLVSDMISKEATMRALVARALS
jgi:Ser/Thr protein kinase RdoA (MazF antagonist)